MVIAECHYCNVCFGKSDIEYKELADHMIKEHEAAIDAENKPLVNMKALRKVKHKEAVKEQSDVADKVA